MFTSHEISYDIKYPFFVSQLCCSWQIFTNNLSLKFAFALHKELENAVFHELKDLDSINASINRLVSFQFP